MARKDLKKIINDEIDTMPLPKDFQKWLQNIVFENKYKMFFERLGPHSYLCSCQHCKTTNIRLDKVKNGVISKCPICNAKVVFRNEKFCKTINEDAFVSFVQKMKDGSFIVREFKVIRVTEYMNYHFSICEMERCYFDKDLLTHLWFHRVDRYNNKIGCYETVWYNGMYKNMFYTLPANMHLYPKNLKNIFAKSKLQYSSLDLYAKKTMVDAPMFIFQFNARPYYEYLIKLKLFKLLTNLIYDDCNNWAYRGLLNFNSNNMKDILKLTGKYYIYAIKHNVSYKELAALQILQKFGCDITKNHLLYTKELEHIIRGRDLHCFNYIGFENLIKYSKEQKSVLITAFLSDYEDYIRACEGLKYNLKDTMYLKPRNFKVMHDRTLQLWQDLQKKNKEKMLKQKLKKYIPLAFSSMKYSLIVPKCSQDILDEGKQLKHCVGTYIDRIVEGDSIILFVRKTSSINESYYTLEINPNTMTMVQCRGLNNKTANKEILKFIDGWLNKVVWPNKLVC